MLASYQLYCNKILQLLYNYTVINYIIIYIYTAKRMEARKKPTNKT